MDVISPIIKKKTVPKANLVRLILLTRKNNKKLKKYKDDFADNQPQLGNPPIQSQIVNQH